VATLLALSAPASAQVLLAHDTLSAETRSAITCGFCAGERFGVIFRELPAPARGLDPEDFPLTLRAVQVAVANARVTGSVLAPSCQGVATAGTATMDLVVWAGETPPSDILELPVDEAWPGEELVFAAIDAEVTRSAAESDGSARYMTNFNELRLQDEEEMPIVVPEGNTYLRVVFTLHAEDGTSEVCEAGELDSPSAFPVRDDDGRIADERSFIYASGLGWVWNEDSRVGVNGDWAVRLDITPAPAPDVDAGPRIDAGSAGDAGGGSDAGSASDAGATVDAGEVGEDDGGCGCRVGARRDPSVAWLALVALLAWRRMRR